MCAITDKYNKYRSSHRFTLHDVQILMLKKICLYRTIEDIVPTGEAIALHSIPTNMSISSELTSGSKVSTVPELSLKSFSTGSSVSHKSQHLSKT